MKNQEYLADDCKKDKELFNSSYYFFLIFIVVVFYVAQKKEIYNAFINGEEIICDNFIVSKN